MASTMITNYDDTKKLYPDTLLFYQVGDFYEMFREDAIVTSRVLDLTLTKKAGGEEKPIPMCGVPIHAIDNYIPKLVQAGYKVAICNQVGEVPKSSKEVMAREVVKVVTAGTQTSAIDENKNNYILAIAKLGAEYGVVWADITTGDLKMVKALSRSTLEDTLVRIRPSEIIVNAEAKKEEQSFSQTKLGLLPRFYEYSQISFQFARAERIAKKHLGVANLSVFDITPDHKPCVMALGALLDYLEETQKRTLINLNRVVVEKPSNFMYLDSATRRNLELIENMTTKTKHGAILGLFDFAKTNMGARLIRSFINEPSTEDGVINSRLDAVEELVNLPISRTDLREQLKSVFDIERIAGKIAYGNVSPKDLVNLAASLGQATSIKSTIYSDLKSKLLVSSASQIDDFTQIVSLINSAIVDDAPFSTKEGGYIKQGFSEDLDTLRLAGQMGRNWLNELENKLKNETGIKNLKVSYNRVFGYYIEVSKSQVNMVPDSWARRQTTTNGERYINDDLKKIEDKILGSEEAALNLEAKIYSELNAFLTNHIVSFQNCSKSIAIIDAISTFAQVAAENGYTRPEIGADVDTIEIIDGRHPVVESLLNGGAFVPNDTLLDTSENRTMVITGPNMAGKSTYMRQVAIITILAHMGSFVPARSARISITDRIFTRIGASDDLAFGQSTFMVEMTEMATILNNATDKSLLILDEIGRGTSTYDGLSIAWAVLEHLSSKLSAKTLFATHYHELTNLEGKIAGIKNYRVLIKELNDTIVFLHKIARGSANRSFGIEVAEIAGLPKSIITRAKEILAIQESQQTSTGTINYDEVQAKNSNTKTNINIAEVISILSDIDMNSVSPLVAFSTLQNLVDKVKK